MLMLPYNLYPVFADSSAVLVSYQGLSVVVGARGKEF